MSFTPFSLKESILKTYQPSTEDFSSYLAKMKDNFSNQTNQYDESYYLMNTKALMGEQEAVSYFQNEIEKYLRKNPYKGNIPNAYSSLIDALFHEWKGFGPAYKWFMDRRYGDSSGLQIIGKQIYVNQRGKFVPYGHEMGSLDRVDQLKRALLKADESKKVDKDHPAEEFKMNDPLWPGRFIRLALWVYPRTWDEFPTISMRRQVIEHLDLEDQAGTGSIPFEAITMMRNLFQTNRNMIFAGPVGSGKSTFANTAVSEQLRDSDECKGVIMIEKHPESILPYVIKNHRIIPVMAKNEDLMEVGIESLRHDPNYIYMTEMRYKEWQFYNWAGSKGYDGLTGTFHTVDAEDIPYQGAIAVYTEQGGNLKGHLISGLQACELVVIMEITKDKKKRVQRISEIVHDEDQQSVFAHDIMRWNKASDKWEYNADLSNRILQRMDNSNEIATECFISELTKLAKKSPLQDPRTESKRSRAVLNG